MDLPSYLGQTPPICLVFGIIGVIGLAMLLGRPAKTQEEDPDAALGRAARKFFGMLNRPKD